MKKQFWAFSLLACLMIGALACPAKNSPTGTGNPTNTPVPPSNTPTLTGTPTDTGTPTSSPTACTPAYSTTYNFTSGPECWGFDGAPATLSETEPSYSTSVTHTSGTGSWMGVVTNLSSAVTAEEIHITIPCASSPSLSNGSTIAAYIQATSNIDAQCFINYGPSTSNCTTSYQNGSGASTGNDYAYHIAPNTWVPVSMITNFAGPQNVGKIGVNVLNITGGETVTIYVADVTISAGSGLPTATPSPTATTGVGYFEGSNYSLTNWSVVIAGGSPTTLSALALYAPGGNAVSCAGVSVTYSATGQAVAFQYSYGGTYTDWTALGVSGLRFYYNATTVPSDNAGIQPYVQSGSGYAYESQYNNLTTAGWQQSSFVPPFTATGSSPVSVDQFGINFPTGGTSTTWASNDLLEISNVELY